MIEKEPGFFGTLLVYFGAVTIWVSGEAGKIFVAGSAGGLMRWMMASRRGIRDGAVAVVAGGISASYLWPGVFWGMAKIMDGLEPTPDAIGMAAFAAGLGGMSTAKFVIAILEARAAKLVGKSNG